MIYHHTYQNVKQGQMAGHYIFIDSTVDDVDHLVKSTLLGTNVVILDAHTDGIEQISNYLEQRRDVQGIHILAHAKPGCLSLGNQKLTIRSLRTYKDSLQSWVGNRKFQAATQDLSISTPQLYLYSCNLAAGVAGQTFLQALQQSVRMPIHASTTTIGSTQLGGNWDLDAFYPYVDTQDPSQAIAQQWQRVRKHLTNACFDPFFPFHPSIQHTYSGILGTEIAKLTAFDGSNSDQMGIASDVHGNIAIVGSKADGDNVGSAYIYTFNGTRWQQGPKLKASDAASGDNFGRTAAIYGNTAVVGAFNESNQQGAVYVFTLNTRTQVWEQTAKIKASDGEAGERFSRSIDLYDDQLIVGAYYDDDNGNRSGSAYIYDFDGTSWQESAKLRASDGTNGDRLGSSVAIKGDVAVVGARDDDPNGVGNSGAVYVYNFNGTNWNETLKLTAGDLTKGAQFGDEKVDVDGNYLVVGSPGGNKNGVDTGAAYVFQYNGSTWRQVAKLTPSDGASGSEFGHGASIDGNTIVVGARRDGENGNEAGAAYVFKRSGNNWREVEKLTASDAEAGDLLGWGISIDGDTVIAGAKGDGQNVGAAYIFDISGQASPPPPAPEEDETSTVTMPTDPQDETDPQDGTGNDQQQGGGNGNDITGTDNDDDITGTDGNDIIAAKRGDDTVDGRAGNDDLSGGRGDDTLLGGNGDDVLNGGRGNDTLQGDLGVDTFVFGTRLGTDTILDFEASVDQLNLSDLGLSFAMLDTTGNGVFDIDDQFSKILADGSFRFNLNSFGGGFIKVHGATSFSEADFVM